MEYLNNEFRIADNDKICGVIFSEYENRIIGHILQSREKDFRRMVSEVDYELEVPAFFDDGSLYFIESIDENVPLDNVRSMLGGDRFVSTVVDLAKQGALVGVTDPLIVVAVTHEWCPDLLHDDDMDDGLDIAYGFDDASTRGEMENIPIT